MAGIFQWLEASGLAVYIRQSPLLFPVIEVFHILGFVFLVGSAFLFDLRLLGISRHIPVTTLAGHLLPWARRSLLVVIPTGLLLFIVQAETLSVSTVFHFKLILIVLAFVNAGIFHRYTLRGVSKWNQATSTPASARMAAVVSILLWCAVISCGRFIAYL